MSAKVIDLELRRDEVRKIRYYKFRIGRCDDFEETLTELKRRITPAHRSYDDRTRYWTVKASESNELRLGGLFDNWVEAFENAKLQIGMFL